MIAAIMESLAVFFAVFTVESVMFVILLMLIWRS